MPSIIQYPPTASQNTNNVLVYNTSQFQSFANTIYPEGTFIYYKQKDKVTGVHKIANGTSTLNALPIYSDDYVVRADDYTYVMQSECLFGSETTNYNGTGYWLGNTTSRLYKNLAALSLTNTSRLLFTPIWYPMRVRGIGLDITLVSTPGDIRMGIYIPDAAYGTWSLVPLSDTPNIFVSTTGHIIYQYSTPIDLEIGIYGFFFTCPSTTSVRIQMAAGVTNTNVPTNKIGVRYPPNTQIRTSYVGGFGLTVPTVINSVLNQNADHVWPILVLHEPLI